MKRTNQCPKCGSRDIIAHAKAVVRAFAGDSELLVATFRKPKAALFRGELCSTSSAWVCVDCGYVEFYVDVPKHLKVPTG